MSLMETDNEVIARLLEQCRHDHEAWINGDSSGYTLPEDGTRAVVVLDPEIGEQRWDLRVTAVFRRTAGGWERVHRQADPLVDRRSVGEAAALLI